VTGFHLHEWHFRAPPSMGIGEPHQLGQEDPDNG